MRTAILSIISIAVAVGLWQCSKLEQLRILTTQVSATAITVTSELPDKEETASQMQKRVSDAELVEFTKSVIAVRGEFETNLYLKLHHNETAFPHPRMRETLSRLTGGQIRAVFDALRGGEPVSKERSLGLFRFLFQASKVNPSAIVPLTYELKNEGKLPEYFTPPFGEWFSADAASFLKWAQEAGMPEGFEERDFYKKTDTREIFDNPCKIWADAAAVFLNPSVANMRRFISQKTFSARSPAATIAAMLDTQEKRLTFFRSLSEASGGVYDNMDYYCGPLTNRVPFEQIAFVADTIPPIRSTGADRKYVNGEKDQLGSFRFEIAVNSRDSTAARRWEWLTKREDDRPSDKQLGRLVDEWCKSDYPDTASWIRSLPPGTLRDAVAKKVIAFLEHNGRKDLVPEWKAEQPTPR